jgi:hypothetical protein
MNKYKYFAGFVKGSLIILILVLTIYGVARANTTIIPPSGAPAASFFTLSDIWTRLTANVAAGTHSFLFADPLAGTHVTLTQIYNAIPVIDATKVLLGTSYLGIPGTMPDNTGHIDFTPAATPVAIPTGFYDGTTKISGALISLGDAIDTNVLTGKHFSNATAVNIPGAMADKGATSYTPSNVAQTIVAGYYNGSGTVATDAYLVTGNILHGISIFGVSGGIYGDPSQNYVLGTAAVAGIALKNLWNGQDTAGNYPGGAQNAGGVDDCNYVTSACTSAAWGAYAMGWTACSPGYAPCNSTTYPGAAYKDNSTGLIWSKTMSTPANLYVLDGSNGTMTWYQANNCAGTSNTCVKPASPATGCEGSPTATGWEVPTQKQLMQAYIDGSYGYLDPGANRFYWSSTTSSSTVSLAWNTTLSYGYPNNNTKTFGNYVRCVRSAS